MTLTDSEVKYIEGILGREMNELEEGMLDVMFSEVHIKVVGQF